MNGPERAVERGAGLLSTAIGLTMTLILLLFAVHVAVALHTRTVVGAAAEEGARAVAQSSDDVRGAEATVRAVLGGLPAELTWQVDDQQVALRVTARAPDVLRGIPVLDALRRVTRTAHVRRELWR